MVEVNTIKTLFTLTKHEVMFLIIGAVIVIVIIKKVIPYFKKFMELRKEFYEKIDKRFDDIESGISKMEKGFNIIYEILLNNMIDEWREKKKNHFADEKFRRIFNKYLEVGDGNADSILKQWESIPFET